RLEKVRPSFTDSPFWMMRVQMGLARCYRACGDTTREIQACRQAIAADSIAHRPRAAPAEALASAGQLAESSREWAALMDRAEPPTHGWLAWARTLIRWTAARPVAGVGWNEAEQILADARRVGTDAVDLALVRAESFQARGQ